MIYFFRRVLACTRGCATLRAATRTRTGRATSIPSSATSDTLADFLRPFWWIYGRDIIWFFIDLCLHVEGNGFTRIFMSNALKRSIYQFHITSGKPSNEEIMSKFCL